MFPFYFHLQLQCRITYIKPTTKLIGLSATNGIVSLQSNSKADDFIGAIEECTVLRADANSGLLVKLVNERKGFVHVSRKELLSTTVPIIMCRIKSQCLLVNLAPF